MKLKKKSQGEIFGIALMFVIIIIGVLIYGKIKAINPNNSVDINTENKYKVLAEGTLTSILYMSTGCEIELHKDRLIDLINFCIQNSYGNYNDPQISCGGTIRQSCSYSKELLNKTMLGFLNSSLLGSIPFKVTMELPRDPSYNQNYSNFNSYKLKYGKYIGKHLTEDKTNTNPNFVYYRDANFNRVTSGIRTWATVRGNIEFQLYLYFR